MKANIYNKIIKEIAGKFNLNTKILEETEEKPVYLPQYEMQQILKTKALYLFK
ncbi:MAG: hypothetical protein RR988_02625 [Clostridia bacterium]